MQLGPTVKREYPFNRLEGDLGRVFLDRYAPDLSPRALFDLVLELCARGQDPDAEHDYAVGFCRGFTGKGDAQYKSPAEPDEPFNHYLNLGWANGFARKVEWNDAPAI